MSNTAQTKSRSRFFSGVVALTAANLFVKVVGLILKIPLRGLLTDAGMAYYNTAYEIYAWLFTIATTGLPIAVSMMISEDRAKGNVRETRRIYRVTSLLFVIIGTVGTAVMFFGAPLFEKAYKIDGSAYCMMAVAPTLFFICVASALRGYFQGYQRMTPTAVSEVIEAVGKLVIGLLLAHYAIKQGYGLPVVAAYAALGLTIGVAGGMLFLLISKALFRPEKYDIEYASLADETLPVRSAKRIMWTLILIAVPITLANSVMSFSTMLDGMILSRRLQSIGYNEEIVKIMIGNYKSCATPLANLPPALVTPITASIIPLMSAAIASGNRERVKRVMDGSLLITAIIEMPCALGLSVLAEPIIKLLFGGESSAEAAAPLLSILSLSVFFISTLSVTSSFLQAHKLERKPIISMLCGAAVKLTASFVLIGIPQINIYGSPIASCLSCFTISAVNLFFIKKYIGFVPDFKKILLRPFAASVVCALAAMGGYWFFDRFFGRLAVVFAILFAMVVYFFVVFLFRAITRDDVMLLPKGEKLCRLLCRVKLLR
ncbi:MAG: polysaccharide biosynthesis protein [Clostridia bacterium]|nr:polysaccharide biosynthesis protein [Clostridia bacterium]